MSSPIRSPTTSHSVPGEAWPAPLAAGPVRGTVRLPGSKSQTSRALVLAALADGPSRLRHPLRARDTRLMAAALVSLGTGVADDDGDWVVTPGVLHGPARVDCGLAGTVMRFVPPVAALADGLVEFDGDEAARRRPMAPLLDALRALHVSVDDDGRGRLPFSVDGTGRVAGGEVRVDASGSSQFVSGLLLAGCRYDAGLTVAADGPVPSLPHVAMTLAMLRDAGVDALAEGPGRWHVPPGVPRAGTLTVEPDLSNAAPFLAAALVTDGEVTVAGWPTATAQPGDALRELLGRLGATVTLGPDGLTVSGTGRVAAADLDLSQVGELAPTLAALAALADGPTTLRGIGHLRGHETDRLAALADGLTALGGQAEVLPDGLRVVPRPLHGGLWRSHADHRMATTGALLGLVVPDLVVDDIATTDKTLPGFVDLWAGLVGAG